MKYLFVISMLSTNLMASSLSLMLAMSATTCPEGKQEWLARRGLINSFLSLENLSLLEYADTLTKCFEKDKNLFENDPRLNACFEKQKNIAKQFAEMKGVSGELKVSSEQYIQDAKNYTEVPGFFRRREFLNAINRQDYAKVKELIEKENIQRAREWKKPYAFVKFKSTVDGTGSRFLIYDPGYGVTDNTEKWINFAVPGKGEEQETNNAQLSVVAVHTDKRGNTRSYYTDHERQLNFLRQPMVAHGATLGNNSTINCIGCHSNGGPLAVRPEFPVEPEYQPGLKVINARIEELPPSFSEHFDPNIKKLGEIIDASGASDKTILSCFHESERTTTNKDSIKRVRDALNCNECHDGSSRSRFDINQVAVKWVRHGGMPPGHTLSWGERFAVSNCLGKNQQLLSETLKHAPCPEAEKFIAREPSPFITSGALENHLSR